jgi:hypothetical protein
MMKGNSLKDFPHLNHLNARLQNEVMKGNSIWELDNFTDVLNRLVGNEAMSMISARLLYMYDNVLW